MTIPARSTDRPAFGIIEVLIAVGMAAVIIVSIGSALAANDRISGTSSRREQALHYARQALEVVHQVKDQSFGCLLPSDGTSPCVKDDQACTPQSSYTSCWTEFPDDPNSATHLPLGPLHVVLVGSTWQFASGVDTSIAPFSRTVTVANPDPSDFGIKTVTVDVSWVENGHTKHVELATEVTGWKNL